nr:hypothetical protein [uncultured Actinoplanes sp.]
MVGSGSLFGSTAVTAVLGFAYWSLIARTAAPASVGPASTLISALTLLGTIGMFGIGTMLISELSQDPGKARTLLPASLAAAGLLSLVLAVLFAVVASWLSPTLRASLASPANLGLFIAGVTLSAVTLVFDQASLGLQIAPVQLWRNTLFAAVKITLIPMVILAGGSSWSITATWILGLVLSCTIVVRPLRRLQILSAQLPRLGALRGLGWATAHHNTLNLALSVPRMAIPVVVGLLEPGEPTAVFYAAWMIAGVLYAIPTHLATTLFAIAAGDLDALRSKTRLTVTASLAIGAIAIPPVALLAEPVMLVFGPAYAAGAGCLIVLVLLYPTQVVKQHYAAILRARGQVRRAGIVCSVVGAAEMLAAVAGAIRADITLVAQLQGAVLAVTSLFLLPAVVSACRAARR